MIIYCYIYIMFESQHFISLYSKNIIIIIMQIYANIFLLYWEIFWVLWTHSAVPEYKKTKKNTNSIPNSIDNDSQMLLKISTIQKFVFKILPLFFKWGKAENSKQQKKFNSKIPGKKWEKQFKNQTEIFSLFNWIMSKQMKHTKM